MLNKTLLQLGLITSTLFSFGQNVSIPDVNFKNYLLSNTQINTNSDTLIQISEAVAFTGKVEIGNSETSDLTGLEAFVNITSLSCGYNSLKSLDITKNTELKYLFCGGSSLSGPYNRITSLDLSKNTKLEYLDCSYNRLSTLDVSNNPLLTVIDCAYNNNLSSLNLSNNLLLTRLKFGFNKFRTINLSKNVALNYLECIGNLLTSLVLTNNTELSDIYCWSNNLSTLDISNNTQVTRLECSYNNLTSLNIANGKSKYLNGEATGNPSLTCIIVDDLVGKLYNFEIDPTAKIGGVSSQNCTLPPPVVYIPDANFKAILVANNSINTSLDNEIQLYEAAGYYGSIKVGSSNISDLTGIEAFTKISSLSCSNNQLTELKIDSLRLLESLDCENNKIQSLNTSYNQNITSLYCGSNELTYLNLKNKTSNLFGSSQNNPNLTCILVNEGVSNFKRFNKDSQTQFSSKCNPVANVNSSLNVEDFSVKQLNFNEFEISTNKSIDGIMLIDMSGRVVYQNNIVFNGIKTIEVNLNYGIYIFKANYQHKTVTKRIIVTQK